MAGNAISPGFERLAMSCEWEYEGYKLSTSGDPHLGPMMFHVIRPDGKVIDVNVTEQETNLHPGTSLLTFVIGRANRMLAIG
jgi:hypothetical protein